VLTQPCVRQSGAAPCPMLHSYVCQPPVALRVLLLLPPFPFPPPLSPPTGREHLSEKGMLFWYDLVGMKNFSGLYCQGISTAHGECQNPTMTIGSAADSMYEYMLKQWVLSNKTQEVRRLGRGSEGLWVDRVTAGVAAMHAYLLLPWTAPGVGANPAILWLHVQPLVTVVHVAAVHARPPALLHSSIFCTCPHTAAGCNTERPPYSVGRPLLAAHTPPPPPCPPSSASSPPLLLLTAPTAVVQGGHGGHEEVPGARRV
jgi:hypothetical protein